MPIRVFCAASPRIHGPNSSAVPGVKVTSMPCYRLHCPPRAGPRWPTSESVSRSTIVVIHGGILEQSVVVAGASAATIALPQLAAQLPGYAALSLRSLPASNSSWRPTLNTRVVAQAVKLTGDGLYFSATFFSRVRNRTRWPTARWKHCYNRSTHWWGGADSCPGLGLAGPCVRMNRIITHRTAR
jgi:hypothetical protein